MRQSRHCAYASRLLTTTGGARGDEKSSIFAPVCASAPLLSGGIPEGLPLGREVAITSGNTEKEGIVFLEGSGIRNWVAGFGRGMHL